MVIKSNLFVILIILLVAQTSYGSIQSTNYELVSTPNSHCTTTNYRGACIGCSAGYFLHLSYCYLVNPNCLTYTLSGTCTSCINGAILEGGLCVFVIPTCADGSKAPCTNCTDGYVIVSGSCVQITSFNFLCTTFANGVCTNCLDGYYLFNGGCTFANPLCSSYFMNNGSCISCYSKYVFVNGTCISLVSINPYCSIANGLICTKCNNGYFLNNNGICILANTLCSSYGPNGECLACSQGTLNSPLCLVTTICSNSSSNKCLTCPSGSIPWNSGCVTLASLYPFCATFQGKKCLKCKSGTYLLNGACLVANPFCSTYDQMGKCLSCNQDNFFAPPLCLVTSQFCGQVDSNGNCLNCQPQYQLFGSKCVSLASLYPYCSSFNNSSCVSTSLGYYLDNDGTFTPSNPLCYTYEINSNACLSCFPGFALWDSACVDLVNLNPFCQNFIGISCTQCQSGYVMVVGFCTFKNPNCEIYDESGGCQSCLHGNLTGPLCIVTLQTSIQTTNNLAASAFSSFGTLNCPNSFSIWGSGCASQSSLYPYCTTFIDQICIDCSHGYYINSMGLCILANPYCRSIDFDGLCLSCAQGFVLRETFCIVKGICKTTNVTTNQCSSCNPGFVVSDGICVAQATINPYCLTYSEGLCINCILGYYLQNGTCVSPIQVCAEIDNITGQCISCWQQYFLINNICLPVSPLCLTYFSNGTCKSCISGYILRESTCISLTSINTLCLKFNGTLCVLCKNRYYLGYKSLCSAVSYLCINYNMTNGYCLDCIKGYALNNGICIPLSIVNLNCLAFNLTKCIKCKPGYFIGIKTICTPVSPLCSLYNMTNGRCINCIQGYFFQDENGICLPLVSINPNCLKFNQTKCINCTQGYYIGVRTICTPVNPLCLSYNMFNGLCLSCGQEFVLYNGGCLSLRAINLNCLKFNSTKCLLCRSGYYLGVKTICMPVNPLCKTYSMTTGICYSCWDGFHLKGNTCI